MKRQWCGHTGKSDNCVQTVHLTYVARDFATIIDSDLYLPKGWCEDMAPSSIRVINDVGI